MQLTTIFVGTLLASLATARSFTLFDDVNFGGKAHDENRNNDAACWNLNGAGDQASSVRGGPGCTTFFQQRDCQGSNWQQRGNAFTVPAHLDNHIWSYRNQC
ncbi:hypothetical protein QQS21_000387 [Conoideocrella luteorostrata]|uniref:Uncharacterized protein n=1 Tax=Conoideocrella luteorostrata TaxID=1105319 RepID=A0AAJ0FYF7_9HYPO|nr:hypothetical protein QQS21_000387 [Conoideocrella luteorostrata]